MAVFGAIKLRSMEIPPKYYGVFLADVKKIYEAELKTLNINPKSGKIAYWEEIGLNEVKVLYNLEIGTTETRHFYLTEKKMRTNAAKDVEESDRVIIAVIKKLGLEISIEVKQNVESLPEKTRLKKEAEFLFLKYLEKFYPKMTLHYDAFLAKIRGIEIKLPENSGTVEVNGDEENIVRESLNKFISDYFEHIREHRFAEAFDNWNPLSQKILWGDEIEEFTDRVHYSSRYNGDLFVFHSRIYSNEGGRVSYISKVYYSETLSIYPRDLFLKLPNSAFKKPGEILKNFETLLRHCNIEPVESDYLKEIKNIFEITLFRNSFSFSLDDSTPKYYIEFIDRIKEIDLVNSTKYQINLLPNDPMQYPVERFYTVITKKAISQKQWQFIKMTEISNSNGLLKKPYDEYQGVFWEKHDRNK